MWKRLFSSCFGKIENDSEDAVGDGWPTEQERTIGGEEPNSGVFGTACSMLSSLGANGGTDRDTSGHRYSPSLHHGGPRSGVAVSTAGVGCGGGESVTQERSPPAETNTTGTAAAARTISPSAPPSISKANRVPAPALASSSFAAMRPSAAVSPLMSTADTVRSQNKSSLRATAPEWRPAAFFAPTASTAVPPTTAPASCSVPSHIATGAGPHHMGAVPPHLMGGAPHGPIQPQQYPRFWSPSMGHHQQQPFQKGDEVLYIRGSDPPLEGVIQKVHAEEYPSYYTVLISVTGREKNTDAAHLRHKKQGGKGVPNRRGHLNGQQRAGPDAFASLGADTWGSTSTGATAVAAAPVRQQAGPQQPPVAPQQAGSHHATKQPTLDQGQEAMPSTGVGMAGAGGNLFRGIESPGLTAETGFQPERPSRPVETLSICSEEGLKDGVDTRGQEESNQTLHSGVCVISTAGAGAG